MNGASSIVTVVIVLVFVLGSVSAYVAPNLLLCKNALTLKAGTVYINSVAQSGTGILKANAGDELAFDFTIANYNSPACQKPVTGVLTFYGSSKDYPENWSSYKTSVETTVALKNLPDGFILIQNQLPIQYSFTILQGEVIRAKLVIKTPTNAKTTLLAFGVATAYLVPGSNNEIVLNTTSTLDLRPIALLGAPATTTPSLAPVETIVASTPASTIQTQKPVKENWNSLTIVLFIVILAIILILFGFYLKTRAFKRLKRLRSREK